jgi:hypothetical protein
MCFFIAGFLLLAFSLLLLAFGCWPFAFGFWRAFFGGLTLPGFRTPGRVIA